MAPSAIVAAAVAALAARYPGFKVEAHGGRFAESDVPLLLAKAPALLLGCGGLPQLAPVGERGWRADWTWALYVLGADVGATGRDALALDTCADLMTWLPEQTWGVPGARLVDPAAISADNLFTGHVNILRVSLWGLTWTQSIPLTLE